MGDEQDFSKEFTVLLKTQCEEEDASINHVLRVSVVLLVCSPQIFCRCSLLLFLVVSVDIFGIGHKGN